MIWERKRWWVVALVLGTVGCVNDGSDATLGVSDASTPDEDAPAQDPGVDAGAMEDSGPPPLPSLYQFADRCLSMSDERGYWLAPAEDGLNFSFQNKAQDAASRFFMKASDLGTYLLYDAEKTYLVAGVGNLARESKLDSDILLLDDAYVSPAEWELDHATTDSEKFVLRQRRTGQYLGTYGLTANADEAVALTLADASGCAPHPELTLDAMGQVTPRDFDDGDVFGIVDTHSHILSNFGFGGGGIFHGAPFHRLGVEHALPDCAQFHGEDGRKDFFGYGFDGKSGSLDASTLISLVTAGQLPDENHKTAGYPTFEEWPNAWGSSTHQTQYYLWLKRAYMAGLRLVVQHATTNSVICDFMVGQGLQPTRYDCNDMIAVDRSIDEAYAMERYIDAQAGGPGKGFFRLVDSPERAREVIRDGKMAVVLGIETSSLFDCYSVDKPGFEACTPEIVKRKLDAYHAKGIRVMFPVHKYDNAFSAGDGNRDFIELGNFIHTGHYSSFVDDCPDIPTVFDRGDVVFGGLNSPRQDYLARPPVDMKDFGMNPVTTLLPHVIRLTGKRLDGDYCQKHGLTDLGETLMLEMMKRGMIIEIDHFNRRSYQRAFDLLKQYDYPAAGTHGNNFNGELYALGGISKMNLGRCRNPNEKGTMVAGLQRRVAQIEAAGGYPAEGFGFDLNGFAGAPRPRFGPDARCSSEQTDPITYPFKSYAGDVTFTPPQVGERDIDFNNEGFVHIGMLPELIEDARRDAESDEDLEPLFRSAEGYLRMWERSEARGRAIP